jgi:hypothetical protein
VILLSAILAGTFAGWGYARWLGRAWHPPVYRSIWLVFAGFLPQYVAFYLPLTRGLLPDIVASACLVLSQTLLSIFAFVNLGLPGMRILLVGLVCNLFVILANGGFMPLSLDAAARLVDQTVLDGLVLGQRVSSASKDVLLAESQISLPWLADRFVPPAIISYRFAFSLGDVLVAVGAFWMLLVGRRSAAQLGDV